MSTHAGTLLIALALLCAPLVLSDFRLSLLGRFLAYAIVALGIDLIWGYTGILSLGHAVYFGLGAYCTAMFLKLEAAKGQLPDFMSWSGLTALPAWWKPFGSAWFALPASILLPMILAAALGYLTFRNRIKGVFFSILSQALSVITVTLFIGQQAFTGGTNGLTDFQTIFGHDINAPATQKAFYFATVFALVLCFLGCRALVSGRMGKILVAIRDGENRVRFAGYDPVAFKVFVYALSAGLAGLAGTLFVLQVGIVSPSQMGIVPSIEMVLWVALGGRGTLVGAVLGAVLVNALSNALSESYPDIWSYFLGLSFVVVVLFLPRGLTGWLSAAAAKTKRWPRAVGDSNIASTNASTNATASTSTSTSTSTSVVENSVV